METVQKLRRGEIEDASKEFCPKAPKLAEYVRREETRLRQLSRPALPSVPARTDFKDWRIIHREKAAAEGRELIQRGASLDDFKRGIKNGTYPLGSTWYWSMGVYGPAKGQAA